MPAGPGRPPKTDDDGVPTRERLLAAAAAAFVERGFEGVTLADIARRADVSTPAIYNHFDGKTELIVATCRWAIEGMGTPVDNGRRDPVAVVRRYLSDEFADARRLQLELHLASMRNPDVADLLAKWHGDNAREWAEKVPDDPDPLATVKAFYLLLLGLAQVDALSSLEVDTTALTERAEALVGVLFPGTGTGTGAHAAGGARTRSTPGSSSTRATKAPKAPKGRRSTEGSSSPIRSPEAS